MIKDAYRLAVFGRSGSGKSCYVKQRIKNEWRIVVFDPLDEYAGELKGYRRATDKKKLIGHIKTGWQRGYRVAYVPIAGHEATALDMVSAVLKTFQSPYSRGIAIPKVTFVIEEMNLSFPNRETKNDLVAFADLCSRGRHYGINLIGVSQRVAEVHTRFRGNVGRSVYFPIQGHRDLTTVLAEIGPSHKNTLQNLKNHHFIEYGDGKIIMGKNNLK